MTTTTTASIAAILDFKINFVLILSISAVTQGVSGNVVTTEPTVLLEGQGYIRGSYDTSSWTNQRFLQFRGVPFAETPSGPLRYKAPIARKPWPNTFDATNWGRRCPVITTISQLNSTQLSEDLEDCLNLCVYTKNRNGKFPVMLYIYGGGFYNGSSSDHPANNLMEKDIVLVVPQFRIGALGHASTQSDEIPGNVAVLDVLFALQWVQDHIASFGGDPGRVTIFGQSAGAAISGAMILSPKTPKQTYFQRSLMQSGSIFAHWALNVEPKTQATRICRSLDCSQCENEHGVNKCLMEASVVDLLKATEKENFSPTLADNYGVIPQLPAELMKQFDNPVSVMTGFTKHDGSFMLATYYDLLLPFLGGKEITVREFIEEEINSPNDPNGLAKNLRTRLFFNRELLECKNHSKATPAYFDLFNVRYLKSPIVTLASELRQKNLAKIYVYTFDYEGETTRFGYEMSTERYPFNGGIHHSDDNLYIFPTHKLGSKDIEMAKKLVELWTTFAITGRPNDGTSLEIKPLETQSGPYFHINTNVTIGYDVFEEFTVTIDDPENYYKLIRNKRHLSFF